MASQIPQAVFDAQVIFVNHSGGKDSQAMLAALVRLGLKEKIVLVHADLGEMEWEPMHDWIASTGFGLAVNVIKPTLDFFELCRKFKRLPSGLARFCTSELKTMPINRWIKAYCAERGITKAVSALGLRGQESPLRAKKETLVRSKAATKALDLTEWLPIHEYTLEQVFAEIAAAGQSPHRVYSMGFSRLSCVFCVFGKKAEHELAAKHRPELFAKIAKLERELGKTIRLKQVNKVKHPLYLDEYISCGSK